MFIVFPKYCGFRPFPGAKRNFVPKVIPIDFEMAEKKVNRQTNKQTDILYFLKQRYEFVIIFYEAKRFYLEIGILYIITYLLIFIDTTVSLSIPKVYGNMTPCCKCT